MLPNGNSIDVEVLVYDFNTYDTPDSYENGISNAYSGTVGYNWRF